MQLKTTTDYAIRAVICLAANGGSMCSTDIAERMGIPPKYLINICVTLREAGLISSRKGAEGGYFLAKDPRDLTLLDVVRAMESTILINRCMEEDRLCSHGTVDTCLTRKVYLKTQEALEQSLSVPITDIIDD